MVARSILSLGITRLISKKEVNGDPFEEKKKISMLETLRKLQPVILDPLSLHGRSRI